jgi:hypothetical protein
MENISKICRQNAEFCNVKACGTYTYHYALKGHETKDHLSDINAIITFVKVTNGFRNSVTRNNLSAYKTDVMRLICIAVKRSV